MKNTHSKLILSVILCFALLYSTNGQKRAVKDGSDLLIETTEFITVKGTVMAFDKYNVKNVEISARKTGSRTITDSLGKFEIMAAKGDVLVFSASGFEKERRKVSASENEFIVKMNLKTGVKNVEIAVGYGHMDESDIPYAYKHSSNTNNNFLRYSTMKELLQAELIGARVVDQGSIQVFTRGREYISATGLSEDSGAALFVLNGMIVSDIDFLDPQDVKSVTLLTDGGSGIYGSQGSNGVVLINTK